MSSDGRYVVFASSAADLVPADTNGATDIFVRDLNASTVGRSLTGSGGPDVLVGSAADDTLTGGAGNDLFIFAIGDAHDTITDFTPGGAEDLIDLINVALPDFGGAGSVAGRDFTDVLALASQVGANTVIEFDALNSITLIGVNMANLTANDFLLV